MYSNAIVPCRHNPEVKTITPCVGPSQCSAFAAATCSSVSSLPTSAARQTRRWMRSSTPLRPAPQRDLTPKIVIQPFLSPLVPKMAISGTTLPHLPFDSGNHGFRKRGKAHVFGTTFFGPSPLGIPMNTIGMRPHPLPFRPTFPGGLARTSFVIV